MVEMMAKVFKGMNVFMSRNLVPPELFDSLHDALKLNGAQVFLCCDPSRNASNDYHVISSPDHEKFDDLRSNGCNLLGPQCVLSCAKEHRSLPKQGFTCCLAMDGVKLLASGFETDQKAEIGKLVAAMGGVLLTKASMDVNFVIGNNVMAAKYKWALNILKKPIVTINWLHQCWKEHRVVPQESFRLPPFSGLIICVSRIPADQRKEMEKLVTQNGGRYSAELTKKCTHLVCASEGDKYKVAKRWGHIHIVTRKWFDQSVARRACLNEESYPVQDSSCSLNTLRKRTVHSQGKSLGNSQSVVSHDGMDPEPESAWYAQTTVPDPDAAVSHNTFATFCDDPACTKEEDGAHISEPKADAALDGCVTNDSQTEDNDLYLSDCKILLAGFDASDMRKLVNMVRQGGGSRYMSLHEKLTHIVVGTPSDVETKQIRNLAALGIIYVVKTEWLEDCNREKKEVPVLRRHIAHDLLLPKDPISSNKRAGMGANGMNQRRSHLQPTLPDDHVLKSNSGYIMSLEKRNEAEVTINSTISLGKTGNISNQQQSCALDVNSDLRTKKTSSHDIEKKNSLNVFDGKLFCFSGSFPADQRNEIVEWVNQGGGNVVENEVEANAQFIVESHGVIPSNPNLSTTKYVSSHWIRSCLMDGCLLDVTSHILYSPLPCQVPFPSFTNFRFCVSQYDEKERLLIRNLCFILGVKFVEKLTKKVTHLLCKFSSGAKYEAACKWGIQPVTSEWIYECVKQSKVVAPGPFCPKEVTSQDREAGACTMTQYPAQAGRMVSGEDASQLPSQSQEFRNVETDTFSRKFASKLDSKNSSGCNKKARILDNDNMQCLSSNSSPTKSIHRICPVDHNGTENTRESSALPDVAAAIEDLLEQTSKIHDQKSPDRSGCDKGLFASDCTILGQDHRDPQSALALPKHWMNRLDRKDDVCKPSRDESTSIYDNFSETQTESQVVGYAEDLSGRQMIIDRLRTRSGMT